MTLPPEGRPLLDDYHNPDDYPTDLTTAAHIELVHLWSDLAEARRNANRGCWSMGCENVAYRIVMLSRLVGATDSAEIDVDLVLDGLYERLHREAGIRRSTGTGSAKRRRTSTGLWPKSDGDDD